MGARLKLLLRVCAVSSSLFLVAMFVAHRAGALGRWFQAETTAVAASPSPAAESSGEPQPEPPVFMGGSKSGVLAPLSKTRPTPRVVRPRPRATATPEETIAPSTPSPKE